MANIFKIYKVATHRIPFRTIITRFRELVNQESLECEISEENDFGLKFEGKITRDQILGIAKQIRTMHNHEHPEIAVVKEEYVPQAPAAAPAPAVPSDYEKLKDDNRKLHTQVVSLTEQIQQYGIAHTELETKYKNLENRMRDKEAQIAREISARKSAESAKASAESDRASVKTAYDESMKRNAELAEKAAKLGEQVKKLEQSKPKTIEDIILWAVEAHADKLEQVRRVLADKFDLNSREREKLDEDFDPAETEDHYVSRKLEEMDVDVENALKLNKPWEESDYCKKNKNKYDDAVKNLNLRKAWKDGTLSKDIVGSVLLEAVKNIDEDACSKVVEEFENEKNAYEKEQEMLKKDRIPERITRLMQRLKDQKEDFEKIRKAQESLDKKLPYFFVLSEDENRYELRIALPVANGQQTYLHNMLVHILSANDAALKKKDFRIEKEKDNPVLLYKAVFDKNAWDKADIDEFKESLVNSMREEAQKFVLHHLGYKIQVLYYEVDNRAYPQPKPAKAHSSPAAVPEQQASCLSEFDRMVANVIPEGGISKGMQKGDIGDRLTELGVKFNPDQLSDSLKILKEKGLLMSAGKTRSTVWYKKNDEKPGTGGN